MEPLKIQHFCKNPDENYEIVIIFNFNEKNWFFFTFYNSYKIKLYLLIIWVIGINLIKFHKLWCMIMWKNLSTRKINILDHFLFKIGCSLLLFSLIIFFNIEIVLINFESSLFFSIHTPSSYKNINKAWIFIFIFSVIFFNK